MEDLILKDATKMPACSASRVLGISNQLLQAQLIYSGIRLDVFSHLGSPKTASEFSNETGYHRKNSELLLNALTSTGFINKENGHFQNCPDTELYLNKSSELYLGEYLLFWNKIKDISRVEDLVRSGPTHSSFHDPLGSDSYDFHKMGEVARTQMYAGRVQTFVAAIRDIFDETAPIKAIDLGGGSGVLAIELAKAFPFANAIVFDQPEVITVAEEGISEAGLERQLKTRSGDFITEDFGNNYNLVIASGVLDFCGDLDQMSKRIYTATTTGGYLYVDTHQINDEFTAPSQCIIGWLSSHMDGLDILKSDNQIVRALENAGFTKHICIKNEIQYYLFEKK
jgi:ubiquinone/menaquinone biosynthesis C-methylase UbiE